MDEDFSRRFRKALKGQSQTSVGKRLKCSQALISSYLAGEIPRSLDIIIRLGKEYKIDLHWLLTGENPTKTENLIKGLKPYILAYLSEILQKDQQLTTDQIKLLSTIYRSREQEQQLKNIQAERESLHQRYIAITDELNEILEIVGYKINDRLPPGINKIQCFKDTP